MKQAIFAAAVLCFFSAAARAQPNPAAAPDPTPAPPENMILIPAGEFQMGTDNRDSSDNNQDNNVPLSANDARPSHKATTKAFFLDKTEVTNAQYQKFVAATGFAAPPDWKDGQFPSGTANWPVTRVNWYEATAYAKWIGKRLPTEIEWEKAARGTDGRNFPWGNDYVPGDLNGDSGTLANVGSFPKGASPYGILDMAGNAMEWTSSWFDAYPGSPTKQPDFGTTLKVVRGGGWTSGSSLGQTWYRSVNRPRSRTMWIGFRCARDAN